MTVERKETQVTHLVASVLLFSRTRRKPRGRGRPPAARHLSPGGDGLVQQQAQTEAGPPQPGNRRAHVTSPSHTPREETRTHTFPCAVEHWRITKGAESLNTTCVSRARFTLTYITTAETTELDSCHTYTLTYILRASLAFTVWGGVGKLLNNPSTARKS